MSENLSLTLLEITELSQLNNDCDRCEDCPDVNFNPPRDSDCPNFKVEAGIAICDKDDGTERTFQVILKSNNLNMGRASVASEVAVIISPPFSRLD